MTIINLFVGIVLILIVSSVFIAAVKIPKEMKEMKRKKKESKLKTKTDASIWILH